MNTLQQVIRGKDWDFGNQDEGSVYGIIQQGSKISRDDFTIIENDNGLRMLKKWEMEKVMKSF